MIVKLTDKQRGIVDHLRAGLIKTYGCNHEYYFYLVPCNVRRNNRMRVTQKELTALRKKGIISGWAIKGDKLIEQTTNP